MLMELEKMKRVLLEDETLDWLQSSTVASSLDVKGKTAIKNIFLFTSLTGCFSQIQSHIVLLISTFSIV